MTVLRAPNLHLHRRLRSLACITLTLVVASLGTPASAAASAGRETFVTMISGSGDYIGGGANRYYHPDNATINVSGTDAYATLRVSGGNLGDYFTLVFAAPPGEQLTSGEYVGAQLAPVREAGRPGIDIYGSGRGCNSVTGRFRVNQISTSPDGSIASLWIVYEQHCGGGTPALIGEVRINIPGDGGGVMINPREIRWPDADVGSGMKVVPIQVVNPGSVPVELSASMITGPSASEFDVRTDECAGALLGPAESCRVFVRYQPAAPGDKLATLTIPEAGGPSHTTALEGFVHSGTTRVLLDSETGDWVGSGKSYDYAPSNATIALGGSHERVQGSIRGNNGDWWNVDFDAPDGDILVPGTTYTASRYPLNGAGAGLDFSGNGHGCNVIVGTFTISDIAVNQLGELERFGASFEQYCNDSSDPALHGLIQFRTDSVTTSSSPRTLEVSRSGQGTVTSIPAGIACGADCSETFDLGTSVELVATPDPGHTFVGWSGACSGVGPCHVRLINARHVGATFRPSADAPSTGYSLDVTKAGTGSGVVTSAPSGLECGEDCTGHFGEDTDVTLTADAARNSEFVGWSGACSGTGQCVLDMTHDREVTASFVERTTLTLSVRKRSGRVYASGKVSPNHYGRAVLVKLYVRRSGKYEQVAKKEATLDSVSAYEVSFRRRSADVCKLTGDFLGHTDDLPSHAAIVFFC